MVISEVLTLADLLLCFEVSRKACQMRAMFACWCMCSSGFICEHAYLTACLQANVFVCELFEHLRLEVLIQ